MTEFPAGIKGLRVLKFKPGLKILLISIHEALSPSEQDAESGLL